MKRWIPTLFLLGAAHPAWAQTAENRNVEGPIVSATNSVQTEISISRSGPAIVRDNRRVRLEVSCPDADPHIPSVVSVYPTADWHERETWDFFGIIFDGHPALTRIEMPDDWPGHPQRKDYPLGGIPVEYKGASIPPPDTRRAYS